MSLSNGEYPQVLLDPIADSDACEAVWNQQTGSDGPQLEGWYYAVDDETWASVAALERFRAETGAQDITGNQIGSAA